MSVYQAKMEREQGFLFRCVDVVMELFAMAATLSRARQMVDDRDPDAARALGLADLFFRTARRKMRRLFRDLWTNEDARKNRLAASVMGGEQVWLAQGAMDIGLTAEAFKTRSLLAQRRAHPEHVAADAS
jgi:hypothetical protein